MVTLYPHQEEAIRKLADGKILWGDVGTGKSLTAAAYTVRNHAGKDIYVITTAKKRDSLDWDKEFSAFSVGRKRTDGDNSGFVGPGGPLTVDSWNNIHKYTEVEDAFFIFDEQRLVGTGKWVKSFYKIARRNKWILLSATPGDTWLDYAPVFIANGFYKNITEFKREHVVYNMHAKFPKVDRYISVGRLVKYRNELLVHMPYTRHTNRVTHIEKCTYDAKLFEKVWKKRWHVYEDRPIRDVAELFSVARKVANSDLSRLRKLQDILSENSKVIVFYNFDYELEMLRSLVRDKTPTSVSPKDVTGSHAYFPDDETALKNEEILAEWMRRKRQSSSKTTALTSELTQSKTRKEDLSIFVADGVEKLRTVGGSRGETGIVTEKSGSRTNTDKWHGTIWGKDAENDPISQKLRSRIDYQIAKDKYELWMRRNDSSSNVTNGLSKNSSGSRGTSGQATRLLPSSKTVGGSVSTEQLKVGSGNTNVLSSGQTSSLQPKTDVHIAEWNGHKHEEIPKTDRWVYLVQYVAGAEGWNCIETDCVVFWSLTYSYKNWHQAHGRIDRLNTPFKDLHYYVLKSDSLIDQAVWRSLKSKKSFNEADFGRKLAL